MDFPGRKLYRPTMRPTPKGELAVYPGFIRNAETDERRDARPTSPAKEADREVRAEGQQRGCRVRGVGYLPARSRPEGPAHWPEVVEGGVLAPRQGALAPHRRRQRHRLD